MKISNDTRRLLHTLFSGPFRPSQLHMQPDHTQLMVYTEHVRTPLTLVRCPTHSNPFLASLVGMLGRDDAGVMHCEEIARV